MNKILRFLSRFLPGVLFGAGLVVSDMINPARVIAFLDVFGKWDPTLMFVMGGALLVSFPLHQVLVPRMPRPLCADAFRLPTATRIDRPLLLGAVLFGLGWGFAGICPGPALAQLALPTSHTFIFLGALLAGQALARRGN